MKGPCVKRRVRCIISTPDGQAFYGENDCDNAQPGCPRLAGEGYEKCKSICQQGAHAEIKALAEAGEAARGATATLYGHYYICEPCGRALREAGVKVLIMEIAP